MANIDERQKSALLNFQSVASGTYDVLISLADFLNVNHDDSTHLLTHTLANLVAAAARHLRRAEKSVSDPEAIDVVAWSARTVLEVDIWSRYVLMSDQNLVRLAQDVMADDIGFIEGFRDWVGTHPAVYERRPEIDSYLEEYKAAHGRQLRQPKKWLTLTEASRALNCELEFKSQYKMYSKVVHITAWSTYGRHSMFYRIEGLACDVARHALTISFNVHHFLCNNPRAVAIKNIDIVRKGCHGPSANPGSPGSASSAP